MRNYFLLAAIACSAVLALSSESLAMRFGAFEVNPFLSVTERFTDNVFNTNTDRQSSFSTVLSPGVEIIFPRTKKRYQVELLYQADLERFNRFSSENADNHKVLGKAEARLPVGLEFYGNDEFNRSHDPRGINISPELDFFKSNLATVGVAYNLSDRFKLKVNYSNFLLDYDADRNKFRNRTDNGVSGYLYYRFLPKTSAFVQYEYMVIDYVHSDDLDSREHHFYAGITWDITGKTKGTVKGGYGIKEFEDATIKGYQGSIVEISIDHNFSPRHSLKIKGLRTTQETNIEGSTFFVTTGLTLEYFHKFTGKITGTAFMSYTKDGYRGPLARRDDTWEGGLGLLYQMRRWLRTEARYSYTKRNSNIEDFTYGNNTYYLKVVLTP
jgi:hypothetical protein